MKIGVSGASGKLGKAVLEELAARNSGHELFGISRTPDRVTPPAQGRYGNYDQPQTLASAYAGLDRLLIIPSADLRPGVRGPQFVAAIDAARGCGIGHIVLMSGTGTSETAEPSLSAAYWTAEQYLMRTAPHWTILRMNHYADSLAESVPPLLTAGVLPGLGESRVGFVARQDVAGAAAGILLGNEHAGAIYNATGPQAVSGAERAALIAQVTGKPFHFVPASEEQLRTGFTASGIPEMIANALIDIERHFIDGRCNIVTGDVEKLAGRPAKPLRDVLTAILSGG